MRRRALHESSISRRSRGDRRVDLAESILYLCALIADQPRAIDRYIDYFGERRAVVRIGPAATVEAALEAAL